jgi:hypothetical protein
MSKHKEVGPFGKRSWSAEKSHWATSIALGALIAAGSFMLVLSVVAGFMPKFFLFLDSRWARLLPAISILFISIGALVRYRRLNRVK